MGCPDDNVLVAMAERSLEPAQFAAIEVHIDSCEHCRKVVAAALSERSLAVGTPQVDETDSLASFADMSINDRYVIEAVLGRGGMGTVYLARDLTLDREVALKLHRATGDDAVGRSARLHREAMAMAKLAHPNVVTVFEVATVEDRLYVAMEYVKGETLRGWLAAQPRTWRAIVAMLLETGQGLAAAHAAGLVHRDFKPENVLVGDDGRPRVGDFGLARVGAAPPSVRLPRSIDADVRPDGPTALAVPSTTAVGTPPRVPRHESPALGAPMTQTGALLGTPAYMAPEQLAGDTVDARCDQFAFCVVAWECLFGKRPFTGATLAELEDAIRTRKLQRPARTEVPTRVRDVLERGLATDPAARYPDIAALLVALRRAAAPRTTRRIALAAAGVVVLAGTGLVMSTLVRERRHEAACAAAAGQMQAVFGPVERVRMRIAFIGTGMPGADAAFLRTEKVLLRYADALAKQSIATCRGLDEPVRVTTARRSCLDDKRRSFEALVGGMLMPDKGVVARSTSAAWAIYDATPCDDVQTLLARAATSTLTTPEVAAQLRRIKTLTGLGRYQEGLELAKPLVAAAHASGDQNAELSGLLSLGHLYADVEDVEQTASSFDKAIALAEKMGRDLDAAAGYAGLANHHGVVTNDYAAAHRAIGLARAKLERIGGQNPAVRGELSMIEAQIFADENRLGDAERAMREAATTIEQAYGPEHPKLGAAYGTLSQILRYQHKIDEALVAAQRTLEVLHAAYGDNHPYVAGAEMTLGQSLSDVGRYAEARERYQRADAVFARAMGDAHPYRAAIAANLGSLDLHEKSWAAAEASFRRALAIIEATKGPVHMDAAAARGDVARAIASSGRIREALAEQEIVVRTYEQLGRDGEVRLIGGLLDLGLYQLDGGTPTLAIATAERALGLTAKRDTDANPAEIDEAKFLLARALWQAGRDKPRARKLAGEVLGSTTQPEQKAEVERWLAEHH